MSTAELTESTQAGKSPDANYPSWKVLVPYGVALIALLPMLLLYFRDLYAQPHYQPFTIAILATISLAAMRWPYDQANPFIESRVSDLLIIAGIGAAVLSVLFVEPWFAALAAMLFVTSLFARTVDRETKGNLWTCALPLYVYLYLPMGMDVRLITTLQLYSAKYTSRLLDLAGLGHFMDGTVINVPAMKEYGIEQACSGVQSFFTLLLVAVVFAVFMRRIKTPPAGVAMLAFFASVILAILQLTPGLDSGMPAQLLILASSGCLLFALTGVRATLLILSAVFWALFMNTIRIMSIPLAEYFAAVDLSAGSSHTLLGYFALASGILLLISTDQFLFFLFGPVDSSEEAGPFGRILGRMWNGLSTEDDRTERRSQSRTRTYAGRHQRLLTTMAGLMLVVGLWQLYDVQQSFAKADLAVRFFDADVTVGFSEDDLPREIDGWTRVRYSHEQRDLGSDLGENSDVWQFRAPNCAPVASFDQPFPGWHELTTCYKNQGWKLRSRRAMTPSEALEQDPVEGESEWGLIEATFEKPTGEQGYLLFSHFDAFGEGLEVPRRWALLNSLFTRAANRLSHRIRASLVRGEAYQVQVFLTSYNEFDPELRHEVRERYLKIREEFRQQFLKKKTNESKP